MTTKMKDYSGELIEVIKTDHIKGLTAQGKTLKNGGAISKKYS